MTFKSKSEATGATLDVALADLDSLRCSGDAWCFSPSSCHVQAPCSGSRQSCKAGGLWTFQGLRRRQTLTVEPHGLFGAQGFSKASPKFFWYQAHMGTMMRHADRKSWRLKIGEHQANSIHVEVAQRLTVT